MTPLASKTAELIAGYAVRERIGAGGYGEVWKAEAPGGLIKAIKFVYGCLDDQRAACELKALNRIKEVRHPFLLSLERIEVIDGQLIIITELADASLKDRFEECKKAGQPGIPREELLVYLHDAADSLDYMSEHFSLQHLDIKPENLLIVGGRVKVADFGLVKDIHDATMSLMSGLTPIYAAPEVFDGRPSLHSDQYSLAIVYQEMLTGVLPFPGRTPTQLAAQHLNSSPRLTPLPPRDRPIIARALAKDPQQRFPSCRAMVEILMGRQAAGPAQETSPGKGGTNDDGAEGDTTSTSVALTRPEGDSPISGTTRSVVERELGQPPPQPEGGTEPANHTMSFDEVSAAALPALEADLPAAVALAAVPSGPCRDTAVELPELEAAPAIEDLPPLEIEQREVPLRPVLILGIGGAAARALRGLHRRLHDRFDDVSSVPAFQMLLLDTDPKTISQAAEGDEAAALDVRTTVHLPLRKCEDYRDRSPLQLQWLSRRWLYNIPRSLKAEGLRPLGRLALVDHARTVLDRLRTALSTATSADALAASAQHTGMPADGGPPRVYVVSSISGGTGSGMVIDAAYAVRAVLAELGISGASVCGMLTHGTPRNPRERDLAIANAYSFLSELQHYHRAKYYPGDEDIKLPPFGADTPAFDDLYLLHLGDELKEEEFEAAADSLAEYLYLDIVTAGSQFFEQRRSAARAAAGSPPPELTLRSFGLHQIGWSQNSTLSATTEVLCRKVVERWCGESKACKYRRAKSPNEQNAAQQPAVATAKADGTAADPLCPPRAGAPCPDLKKLIQQTRAAVERELGGSAEACLPRALDQELSRADLPPAEEPAPAQVIEAIQRIVGPPQPDDKLRDSPVGPLQKSLVAALQPLVAAEGAPLSEWILGLLDGSDLGAAGVQRAAQSLVTRIRELETETAAARERLRAELTIAERELLAPKPPQRQRKSWLARAFGRKQPPRLDPRWLACARLRLEMLVLQGAGLLLQGVRTRVVAVGEELSDLKTEIVHLAGVFGDAPNGPECRQSGGDTPAWSERQRSDGVNLPPELIAQMDERWRKEYLDELGGLRGVAERRASLCGPLVDRLRRSARKAVVETLRKTGNTRFLVPLAEASAEASQLLQTLLDKASPRLRTCGGAQSLLLVCPAGATLGPVREAIQRELHQAPSVVFDSDGDVVLCYELEAMSLRRVAARLIENRRDYAQIASRVHTRVDVAWSSL